MNTPQDPAGTFPAITVFEERVFRIFAKNHKPGFHDHAIQLEGNGRIAVCAAAHRMIKKGLLIKHGSCRWYLTDLGKRMAVDSKLKNWKAAGVEISNEDEIVKAIQSTRGKFLMFSGDFGPSGLVGRIVTPNDQVEARRK